MANQTVQDILQYQFRNPKLLEEALHAAGSTPKTTRQNPREHGNKGLALIGDAVLRLAVVDDGILDGKTTQNCHQICVAEISNIALSKKLQKWKIVQFVKLAPAQKGVMSQGTGASTAEALIGAVWIDSDRDISTVHRVIHKLDIASEFLHGGNHLCGRAQPAVAA
ncbi:ribonuclease III domain-containing protein [Trichoderma chlorosporum]